MNHHPSIIDRLLFGFSLLSFIAVFCTAFVVDTSIDNGIMYGKQYWFCLSMASSCLSTFALFLRHKQGFTWNFTDLVLSLFYVTALVVSLVMGAIHPTKISLFTLLYVLYWQFRFVLVWQCYQKILLWVLVGVAAGQAFWGILQYQHIVPSYHGAYTTGAFPNPGPYGGFLAMLFPVALFICFQKTANLVELIKQKKYQWTVCLQLAILLSINALLVYTIILSESRAAWLATTLSGVFIVLAFALRQVTAAQLGVWCKAHWTYVALVATMFVGLTVWGVNSLYHIRPSSADARVLIWKTSLSTLNHNKLGVGLGAFPGAYSEGQATYFALGVASESEKNTAIFTGFAYNEYLQIGIECGLLGLLFFMLTLLFTLYYGLQFRQYAAVGALLSLMVFCTMGYPFSMLPFGIVFVFLLALCTSGMAKKQVSCKTNYRYSLAFLCVLNVVAIAAIDRGHHTYNALQQWVDLRKTVFRLSTDETLLSYANLYTYLGDNRFFLNDYARILTDAKQWDICQKVLLRNAQIDCSSGTFYKLAHFYLQVNKPELAELYCIKALNLAPQSDHPLFLLAKIYWLNNKKTEACQVATFLFTKYPQNETAQILHHDMCGTSDESIDPD